MSTSMLDKSKIIFDTETGSEGAEMESEDLSQYVKRVMRSKRLSLRDVQRQSGDRITQGYVGAIVQKANANLTVEKLRALADGLNVDEEELFRVARGVPRDVQRKEPTAAQTDTLRMLELMRTLILEPELLEILEEVLLLPRPARNIILKTIRALNDTDKTLHRNNRVG
jgi:transcriptional regulator with XRE-family HTH domain